MAYQFFSVVNTNDNNMTRDFLLPGQRCNDMMALTPTGDSWVNNDPVALPKFIIYVKMGGGSPGGKFCRSYDFPRSGRAYERY